MASSSSSETKRVKLIAGDMEVFEVDESIAKMCVTFKAIIEDDCEIDTGIPVPNVTGPVLAKVLEYCKKHVGVGDKPKTDPKASSSIGTEVETDDDALADEKEAEKAVAAWDKDFAKVDWSELSELLLAANFLNIQGLLDLLCKTAADHIKDKMPEEIREIFNITNDFTPEEEAAIRKENEWAFVVDN